MSVESLPLRKAALNTEPRGARPPGRVGRSGSAVLPGQKPRDSRGGVAWRGALAQLASIWACLGGLGCVTERPVVTIIDIAPAPATALASPPSSVASAHQATAPTLPPSALVAGVWRDPETNTHFTILVEKEKPTVVAAVDEDDGEAYDLAAVHFEGGALTWSYRVPSTGTFVTFTTSEVTEKAIVCTWTNSVGASGRETLERVK